LKNKKQEKIKDVQQIILSIDKRARKRNKNIEDLTQSKENYLSFMVQRNHENELKHQRKISMTKRKDMSRKDKLINGIMSKNYK
jgi:UDP-3-O-[3-hydroxymyristoyl] glucosamine N-acyltransferase